MKMLRKVCTLVVMIILSEGLLSGMSRDEQQGDLGFPWLFVPAVSLPPIQTNSTENSRATEINPELVQLVESIFFEAEQAHDIKGKEREEDEENEAQSSRKRRKINQQTEQLARPVTSSQSESESIKLLEIEELEVSLDELDLMNLSPQIVRVTVKPSGKKRLTPKLIKRLGQIFPNLRELIIEGVGLQDSGLRELAGQPFAPRLTLLNISKSCTTNRSIQENIGAFKSLTNLDVSYNYGIGDVGLALIAQQSFAGNLTSLNIALTHITMQGFEESMGEFTRLTALDISDNNIGDKGFAILAKQPFAHNLIKLVISGNKITAQGITANINAFTSLTQLDISNNNLRQADVAAIVQQPWAWYVKISANNLKA